MLGKHRFKRGQRVRPSPLGIERHILARSRDEASGVVKAVDRFDAVRVMWDHRKTTDSYHSDFLAPDRRRPSRRPSK